MAFLRIAALLGLLLAVCDAYSGDATAYGNSGGRGRGHCDISKNLGQYETYYASINKSQFSMSKCGQCVRISGARGSVVAMVVDSCATCPSGDIDMSSEALKKATGYSWDRKTVNWSFVSCSGGSSGGGGSTRSRGRSTKPRSKPRRSSKKPKRCPSGRKGRSCRRARKAARGRKMLSMEA